MSINYTMIILSTNSRTHQPNTSFPFPSPSNHFEAQHSMFMLQYSKTNDFPQLATASPAWGVFKWKMINSFSYHIYSHPIDRSTTFIL